MACGSQIYPSARLPSYARIHRSWRAGLRAAQGGWFRFSFPLEPGSEVRYKHDPEVPRLGWASAPNKVGWPVATGLYLAMTWSLAGLNTAAVTNTPLAPRKQCASSVPAPATTLGLAAAWRARLSRNCRRRGVGRPAQGPRRIARTSLGLNGPFIHLCNLRTQFYKPTNHLCSLSSSFFSFL
jgi:hypothetical protein